MTGINRCPAEPFRIQSGETMGGIFRDIIRDEAHDPTAGTVIYLYHHRQDIKGFKWAYGPRQPRFFTGRVEPLETACPAEAGADETAPAFLV